MVVAWSSTLPPFSNIILVQVDVACTNILALQRCKRIACRPCNHNSPVGKIIVGRRALLVPPVSEDLLKVYHSYPILLVGTHLHRSHRRTDLLSLT